MIFISSENYHDHPSLLTFTVQLIIIIIVLRLFFSYIIITCLIQCHIAAIDMMT